MCMIKKIRCGVETRVLSSSVVEIQAMYDNGSEVYVTSMYTDECGGIERIMVGPVTQFELCMAEEEDHGEYADVEFCDGEMTGDDAGGKYDELIAKVRDLSQKFRKYVVD